MRYRRLSKRNLSLPERIKLAKSRIIEDTRELRFRQIELEKLKLDTEAKEFEIVEYQAYLKQSVDKLSMLLKKSVTLKGKQKGKKK